MERGFKPGGGGGLATKGRAGEKISTFTPPENGGGDQDYERFQTGEGGGIKVGVQCQTCK